MMISICGSPESGKSTLALKLAQFFLKEKKQVILVQTDYYTPTFVTFFPEEEGSGSLGKLLSLPEITQEEILRSLLVIKGEENLGVLSYAKEETRYHYPEYTKDRAVEVIIQLKHMADVVIVDCQTAFFEDLFAITALEMADRTLRVLSADLKGISYYRSCMPLLADSKFSPEKAVKIIQDTKNTGLLTEAADAVLGADMIIPYTDELRQQYQEEAILAPLGKKGKDYEKRIRQLAEGLRG